MPAPFLAEGAVGVAGGGIYRICQKAPISLKREWVIESKTWCKQ
jgi:hypothetical protein